MKRTRRNHSATYKAKVALAALKIPSFLSRRKSIIGLVRGAVFDDTEAQVDEFAHGGAEDGHFGFPACQQSVVKRLDMRVATNGHDGGHIQDGADAWGA